MRPGHLRVRAECRRQGYLTAHLIGQRANAMVLRLGLLRGRPKSRSVRARPPRRRSRDLRFALDAHRGHETVGPIRGTVRSFAEARATHHVQNGFGRCAPGCGMRSAPRPWAEPHVPSFARASPTVSSTSSTSSWTRRAASARSRCVYLRQTTTAVEWRRSTKPNVTKPAIIRKRPVTARWLSVSSFARRKWCSR